LKQISLFKVAGNQSFTEKKYAEALSAYGQALPFVKVASENDAEKIPSDLLDTAFCEIAKIYGNMAECHLQMGDFQDALEKCDRALSYDPEFVKVYVRRARAFWGLSSLDGAVSLGAAQQACSALKDALRLDPQSEQVKVLLESVLDRCKSEYLLKELEIIIENEDSDEDEEEDPDVKRLMNEYAQKVSEAQNKSEASSETGNEAKDEQLEQLSKSKSNIDPFYMKFKLRTEKNKSQCVRYCFSESARPLWIMSRGQIDGSKIPQCPLCGGKRQFEFQASDVLEDALLCVVRLTGGVQVMPQLLFYLEPGEDGPAKGDLDLDWGCVAVYSCAASCEVAPDRNADSAYADEFVWVQPQPA
jgi:tetratricopeptide (TPR) repeat protein